MIAQDFFEKMKITQDNLLKYLDNLDDSQNFVNIKKLIDDQKIHEDQHKLKSFLHLLLKISNNHHRSPNFFNKIIQILQLFKEEIKKKFPNWEIFEIFKNNKRILLFLIEEQIIVMDGYIAKQIAIFSKNNYLFKYIDYFEPEMEPFLTEHFKDKYDVRKVNEISDDFFEKRKIGENDSTLCELIRKDSIAEFIRYTNQSDIQIEKVKILPSIFETNNFLIKQQSTTLIEYAAFFGSIKIIKYLQNKNIELTSSLWLYGVHSNSEKIINFLEENNVEQPKFRNIKFNIKIKNRNIHTYYFHQLKEEEEDNVNQEEENQEDAIQEEEEQQQDDDDYSYKEAFIESIKCHHNDIANYFLKNCFQSDDNRLLKIAFINGLKNYNFDFFQDKFINENSIYDFCKYDYFIVVDAFLKQGNININQKTILVIMI
ncbi:hypothetical protein M9Y10_008055 [Tritrichomonas musculus]|uniref:DUF3447 domain-containing protein n=1 Tax=Tritrichomonas musculus TaxID=1915356 RepID=A0ABR2IX84_9EUKA